MAKKNQTALEGFIEFVKEQGVIGLAIGIILGGAVLKMVESLVSNVINPLIGWVLGSVDLASHTITLADPTLANPSGVVLGYGSVIASAIDFIAVAAVVYFGVKALGLDNKKK